MDASIGSCALRSTACFFMLGGRKRDDLRKTSRHKSAEYCNSHEQDNATLYELLQYRSSSDEILLLVPTGVSNHFDHRNFTSLINALVSDNGNDELKSLKHQANKFLLQS